MFGVAAVSALLALIMLSAAAAWGLAEVMAPGWAFLIVGAIWAVVAGFSALMGRKTVAEMEPGPARRCEEIKEDKEWIKTQSS